jgi:hypothetical protein
VQIQTGPLEKKPGLVIFVPNPTSFIETQRFRALRLGEKAYI